MNDHTPLNQGSVFMEGEGNAWFARNIETIAKKTDYNELDAVKRTLSPFSHNINDILEIGCSSGDKLAHLCLHFDAKGKGVDPSATAVEHGNRLYAGKIRPSLALQVATASDLPFPDESFDLVYFGFCLYLVDRKDLFKAIAEADRVLKLGGYLAILDFDPSCRNKRPYAHKPGVYSYKTSYADFFTSGGHYYLVSKDSMSHGTPHFTPDSDERVSLSVLFKELDPY
ncbi:MAG: class I SAM-dependent methyltransferase [Burkholderiales bacterium]|nr:MAG: class I SAM-dependent methyltransferase [Burkholderiales bacterium]